MGSGVLTLFPNKNVFGNIAFGLTLIKEFSKAEINKKVLEISATLGITHLLNRGIEKLSGGELQRVGLARALILNKPFLILDEPTSSLHETMQESFCLLIKNIQAEFDLTILMTTHHKDSAFMLADTFHFIENGRLIYSEQTENLSAKSMPLKVAELLGITNVFTMQKLPEDHKYFCAETQTAFELNNVSDIISNEFRLGVKPVDIRIVKEDEKHLLHLNSFQATVENILNKESDALVFLKIAKTDFIVKAVLSAYNVKKMNLQKGKILRCKIKEEYSRLL